MDIPSIDLNKFPDSNEYKKLREASEEWGCFRLVNHNIPLTLMSEMKKVATNLLDRPIDIKMKNKDVIPSSGYFTPAKPNPLFENLGLYDCGNLSQSVDTFCSQLDASPYEREVIEKYATAVHEVMVEIGQKVAESLGANGDFVKEWGWMVKMNKFNFTPESVGSFGVRGHTDTGFMTILQPDESVGGLEVMSKSGDFLPVEATLGSLLVNLGDIAKVWSNGKLCNVKHRVRCLEGTVRVSIASLMVGPKEEAIETSPEFVDSDHPALYKPFTYAENRQMRITTELHAGEALDLFRIKVIDQPN